MPQRIPAHRLAISSAPNSSRVVANARGAVMGIPRRRRPAEHAARSRSVLIPRLSRSRTTVHHRPALVPYTASQSALRRILPGMGLLRGLRFGRVRVYTGIKRVREARAVRAVGAGGDVVGDHGAAVLGAVDAGVEFVEGVVLVVAGGCGGWAGGGRFTVGAVAGAGVGDGVADATLVGVGVGVLRHVSVLSVCV